MGQSRRSVTPEFKQDAVDLCRRSGKSECQVARELGIPQPTFNRWMRQVAGAPLGSNRFLATEELKVLRREVEQLRMERDILKKSRGLLCQGVGMRYRFIQAEKASYPVEVLCRVLTVARSGYYAWCRRPLGARAQQNQGLLTQIRTCYQASRGCYGSPRIHHELRAHGLRVGRHRVARLMRRHGLRSVRRPRSWRQPAGALPAVVRANVLRRAFTATRPNEKWAADITYVPTRQGWLYLAVVIDLYSRRVVGWAMDAQQTTALTVTALEMALRQRPVLAGLLHHSDRGSQYGAVAYQHRLGSCGIRGSMSRPGNCWDNAVVESFFATLKTELMRGRLYHTRQDARTEIFA